MSDIKEGVFWLCVTMATLVAGTFFGYANQPAPPDPIIIYKIKRDYAAELASSLGDEAIAPTSWSESCVRITLPIHAGCKTRDEILRIAEKHRSEADQFGVSIEVETLEEAVESRKLHADLQYKVIEKLKSIHGGPGGG